MHNSTSGLCTPTVHAGINGRVHVFLGPNAPSIVGSREEMRELASLIQIACGKPEPLIEGEILFGNADLHPAQAHA